MVGPGRHERPPFFQRVGAPKACRMSERRLRVSHSRMASARAHTECGGLAPLLFARREGSGFARQHRFRAGAFQALGPNAPPSKCKIRAPARRALPARAISRGSQGYRHRPSRRDGRAPALRAWAADGRRQPLPATRHGPHAVVVLIAREQTEAAAAFIRLLSVARIFATADGRATELPGRAR